MTRKVSKKPASKASKSPAIHGTTQSVAATRAKMNAALGVKPYQNDSTLRLLQKVFNSGGNDGKNGFIALTQAVEVATPEAWDEMPPAQRGGKVTVFGKNTIGLVEQLTDPNAKNVAPLAQCRMETAAGQFLIEESLEQIIAWL